MTEPTALGDGARDLGDLLVRAGKVVQVGQRLAAPAGATVVDATGKHVTAGLIDPHTHSGTSGTNESGFAIVPEVQMGDVVTHNNIWSNVQACLQMIPIGPGDECLSMLPLSHSYERMVDYTLFQAGVMINFAESFDTVAANLGEVKPTVVLSVPRLYEKVYARVLENALSGSAVKRAIFFWAKRAGEGRSSDCWSVVPICGIA